MAYLILSDFKKLIQTDNLSAIIGADFTILDQMKLAAQTEVTSYLTQKYDCSREFTDTLLWNRSISYKGGQRVYLDADTYVPATAYTANNLTLYAGNIYICTTSTTGPFDATKWTLIGAQYAMFYVTLPYPEFNYGTIYSIGTQTWWKDKIYTARIATLIYSHETMLNINSQSRTQNFAPDDITDGLKYWGTGTAYTVAAGTLPTDTTKWTAGDNRNQQLVNYCIDVALYTVHSRIAPRNIPELRVKRYDDVIKWLKNVAQGKEITAAMPLIQPSQGMRIRWGGDVKRINNY